MKSEWVVTDCFWVIAPYSVRSSRPAALHLAKDKANRTRRRCEGLRWTGPPQGSTAHAGCDVCVCATCVCVPLWSWAQCKGHNINITEAYLKLYILCMWLSPPSFFCLSRMRYAHAFESFVLKTKTTPSCDCFAEHKKDTFFLFFVADCLQDKQH